MFETKKVQFYLHYDVERLKFLLHVNDGFMLRYRGFHIRAVACDYVVLALKKDKSR